MSAKSPLDEILEALTVTLATGDIPNLDVNKVVNTMVKNVSDTVERAVGDSTNKARMTYTELRSQETRERQRIQREAEERERQRRLAEYNARAPFKAVGKVGGILSMIFGWMGCFMFGITSIVGCAMLVDGEGIGVLALMLPFLVASILLVKFGSAAKKRCDRAWKYLKLAGNNHYINLEDLAMATGQTKKALLKDIKNILAKGHYPQGHLDRQQTCLMLDDKIFREYLEIEKQRKATEKERKLAAKEEAEQLRQAQAAEEEARAMTELDAMIAEGQDYIKQLREMNEKIPGEEISTKLFKLENILKEIFEKLREHPDQQPQMKKVMSYYLPTTIKLVSAYEEFDKMSNQGADILEAKGQIEQTLDSINDAFAELLNRMLRDKAFDVAADAQVLKTMLAQEGLTGDSQFGKATTIPQ